MPRARQRLRLVYLGTENKLTSNCRLDAWPTTSKTPANIIVCFCDSHNVSMLVCANEIADWICGTRMSRERENVTMWRWNETGESHCPHKSQNEIIKFILQSKYSAIESRTQQPKPPHTISFILSRPSMCDVRHQMKWRVCVCVATLATNAPFNDSTRDIVHLHDVVIDFQQLFTHFAPSNLISFSFRFYLSFI